MDGEKLYLVAEHPVVTAGVAQVTALAPRSTRVGALFINDSDTTLYLALGRAAVLNSGIRLSANGGSYEINLSNPWRGDVHVISSAATKLLLVTETYLSEQPQRST